MPLDQVENFVEVNVAGTHSSTETTISLQSGEASNLPDPSGGEFNLVWFDSTNFSRPSEDNSVEIVRVTGRDTTNDTITVQRGQEDTSAVAHDTSDAVYQLILSPTSKVIKDVDAANFETNSLTVANTTIGLGGSGTPEADNFAGNNGTSGQVLQTDGSNLSYVTPAEKESVKTVSSDFTTSGETTIFVKRTAEQISFTNNSLDVSSNIGDAAGLRFNDTGTKMYIVDTSNNDVTQFTLSTAYDITTASPIKTFDVSSQDSAPLGIDFNDTGSKMYIIGRNSDQVHEYNLSTNFDIGTASINQSFGVGTEDDFPQSVTFGDSGSKMFVCGAGTDKVYEYSLSTAFDVSTASLNDSLDVSSDGTFPADIRFKTSGVFYVASKGEDALLKYQISVVPFNISSGSFIKKFDVSSQSEFLSSFAFDIDNSNIKVLNDVELKISDYQLLQGLDTLKLSSEDTTSGKIIRVKDISGEASVSSIVIQSETGNIDDTSNAFVTTDFGVKQFQSDGTEWYIISNG